MIHSRPLGSEKLYIINATCEYSSKAIPPCLLLCTYINNLHSTRLRLDVVANEICIAVASAIIGSNTFGIEAQGAATKLLLASLMIVAKDHSPSPT